MDLFYSFNRNILQYSDQFIKQLCIHELNSKCHVNIQHKLNTWKINTIEYRGRERERERERERRERGEERERERRERERERERERDEW